MFFCRIAAAADGFPELAKEHLSTIRLQSSRLFFAHPCSPTATFTVSKVFYFSRCSSADAIARFASSACVGTCCLSWTWQYSAPSNSRNPARDFGANSEDRRNRRFCSSRISRINPWCPSIGPLLKSSVGSLSRFEQTQGAVAEGQTDPVPISALEFPTLTLAPCSSSMRTPLPHYWSNLSAVYALSSKRIKLRIC